MALDATTVYALSRELNGLLKGAKIEKIHQSEAHQITLALRADKKSCRLLLSASSSYPRVHLAKEAALNPESPPMFCMLLRKRLISGRIQGIVQIDMERVIKITILSKDELLRDNEYALYCEMMGRHSNIILVGEDGIIIDSIKRVDEDKSRVRQVLPGMAYTLPPPQDKLDPKNLSLQDIERILIKNADMSIQKVLQTGIAGISGNTLSFLYDGKYDIDAPVSRYGERDIELIAGTAYAFYSSLFSGNAKYYMLLDESGSASGFTLLDRAPSIAHKEYGSLSSLLDDYYGQRALKDNISRRTQALRQSVKTQLERAERKLKIQQDILSDEKKLDKCRIYGELVTSYSYMIPKGAGEAELDNFYSETGEKITVPLDPRLTPSANAAKYFKKYKKLKKAIDLAHGQIKEISAEINYLDNTLHAIENCDSEDLALEIQTELMDGGYIRHSKKKTSRKLPPSKPHRFLSSDGHEIYVGRNNKQNDVLTMRFARADDIWLHTKDIPGSHVIIRAKNNNVSQKAVNEGAFLAAWFSKARNSSNVPVDYTQRRNIRKPNGSKPGYVIYLSNSTANVTCTKEQFAKIKKEDL